ncbi:MAG: hypothetical protein KF690_01240 [Bacteroidetes bacterium]|nr:hypothetical protein [Bacteroidota bacterium]
MITPETLDQLDDTTLHTHLESLQDRCLGPSPSQDPADWQQLLHVLTYVKDAQGLLNALDVSRHLLDTLLETAPQSPATLEFLVQWNMATVRWRRIMLPQGQIDLQVYENLPCYQEIIVHTETAAPEWAQYGLQAVLHLLVEYTGWQLMGGQAQALPAEDREWLAALQTDGLEDVLARMASWREQGYMAAVVPVQRALARYYITVGKPNEGRLALKQLLEDLPATSDCTPAHLAEVEMELGQLLLQFGKHAASARYFREAQAHFAEAGEEWEMQAAQAEEMAYTAEA